MSRTWIKVKRGILEKKTSEKKYNLKEVFELIRNHCVMCDKGVAGSNPVLLATHEVSGHCGEEWGEEAIECEYCGRMISGIKNKVGKRGML